MTQDAAFVFLLIGVAAVLMASNRVRYDFVALIVVLALILGEILTVGQALSGFGSSVVIMVACLLVVGEMLERTGVARAVGNMILRRGGNDETRLLFLLMVSAAFLGSVMSSTAVVAIFIPIVLRIANDTGLDKSRMLLPMSYAALISGMLTLIATTPNLVVSDELVEHGFDALGFFSFFPLGLVILCFAVAYMLLWGRRLLGFDLSQIDEAPRKTGTPLRAVWDNYRAEDNVESLAVTGRFSHEEIRDLSQAGLEFLARIRRTDGHPVPFREGMELEPSDKILVSGQPEALIALANNTGLERMGTLISAPDDWLAKLGVADVLVHPEASITGRTVKEALEGWSEALHALSLIRDKAPLADFSTASLQPGDRLLVAGPWSDIDALTERASDIPCMTELVHASAKGSKDDHFQGITGRTAAGLRAA